jgi:hypothetical protein
MDIPFIYRDHDTPHEEKLRKVTNVIKTYGEKIDVKGNLLSSKSAKFAEFAELVKEKSNNRIAWGGDWTKKDEEHHFELRGWRDKYKNEENLIC